MSINEYKLSLAGARVSAGYTQEALAAEMGVTRATVVNWESGKTEISAQNLKRFCEIVKAPIDLIFLP